MWCPKCKAEYRKGIKICAECDTELVEKLNEEKDIEEIEGDVSPIMEDDTEMDEDTDGRSLLHTSSKSYVKKADQYKDMVFSGISFLIFGLLGAVYLTLCKMEVIPISYNLFVFIGISAMFAIFIIIGITSLVKAGKIKTQIPDEEKKTEEIMNWLSENIQKDSIDKWKDTTVSDVENDLLITERIANELFKQYPDLDSSYLEMIADEYFDNTLSDESDLND